MNTHTHKHEHAAPHRISLMAMSAGQRLLMALTCLALLWALVAWALEGGA